jgi:hypothetical protein
MKFSRLLIVIIAVLFIAGCDPHDGKLTLVNNTDDTLFYSFSCDNDSISSYPINQKDGKDNYADSYIIQPKSENHEPVMGTWEYFVNKKCKDSSLRIFFFSKDLIRTAGKDSIMKYQLCSKRERLKVKELEKLHWRIAYP